MQLEKPDKARLVGLFFYLMLTFANPLYKVSVLMADFTGQTVPVYYILTASTFAQADTDAKTIASKLKAISSLQVKALRIDCKYDNVDSDPPGGDKEDVAYFAGETVSGRWAVQEVPGYNGPLAFQNNIDLSNTLVNDYLILWTGGKVYGYDSQLMSEFCRGWVLNRNTQIL